MVKPVYGKSTILMSPIREREGKFMLTVLSIDAWADGDGWGWNSWSKVGEADESFCDLSDESKLDWFVSQRYLSKRYKHECIVIDDGHNYVLTIIESGEPLYAVEYGE